MKTPAALDGVYLLNVIIGSDVNAIDSGKTTNKFTASKDSPFQLSLMVVFTCAYEFVLHF